MIFAFVLVLTALSTASALSLRGNENEELQEGPVPETDVDVLNFALALEHLEEAFYYEGSIKYSAKDFADAGYPAKTFALFEDIYEHEQVHVATLQAVISSLGGTPVLPCTYDFGLTGLDSYIQLARALETTGVSAYTGAARRFKNKNLLTAAATILSIEARHASYIENLVGMSPFPNSFDIPLNADQIQTIASPVIVQCPVPSPYKNYGPLALTPASASPGDVVSLAFTTTYAGELFCVFLQGLNGGVSFTKVFVSDSAKTCMIPQNVSGLSYVLISKFGCEKDYTKTDATVAGPTAFYAV